MDGIYCRTPGKLRQEEHIARFDALRYLLGQHLQMRSCKAPVEIGLAPPLFSEHKATWIDHVAVHLIADAPFLAQRRLDDAPDRPVG